MSVVGGSIWHMTDITTFDWRPFLLRWSGEWADSLPDGETRGEDARRAVVSSARGERHHERDDLRGRGLRRGALPRKQGRGRQQDGNESCPTHTHLHVVAPSLVAPALIASQAATARNSADTETSPLVEKMNS